MVAHDLMVCKMTASQRYSDGATALLGSYLSDRTQCVRSDGDYSTVRGIECGVPQGSVLLFISFIDDVSGVIHFCRFIFMLMTCRFTIVPLLLTFRDVMMRLMLT
jgi:hypothetical protein